MDANMQADALRYRYLRTKAKGYDGPAQAITFYFPWDSLRVGNAADLDDAIDKAIDRENAG